MHVIHGCQTLRNFIVSVIGKGCQFFIDHNAIHVFFLPASKVSTGVFHAFAMDNFCCPLQSQLAFRTKEFWDRFTQVLHRGLFLRLEETYYKEGLDPDL